MTNDLIKIDVNSVAIFEQDGLQKILDDITAQVDGMVFDISTQKGRKECASMAYKISQSKTYLDDLGKNLVADLKQKTGKIDASRKYMRDYLDGLRDKVRQPLTDLENTEKQRVLNHQNNLKWFSEYGREFNTVEALREAVDIVQDVDISGFEEFTKDAEIAKTNAHNRLLCELIRINRTEEQRKLAEKLRVEREEKEREEREKLIAENAAKKAKEDAEKAHHIELERIERERLALENAEKEARLKAEREALEAERRAQLAQKQAEMAAENERKRIEAEQEKAEKERLRLEQDRLNREKVHTEILQQLQSVTDFTPENVLNLIIVGGVNRIRINYQ